MIDLALSPLQAHLMLKVRVLRVVGQETLSIPGTTFVEHPDLGVDVDHGRHTTWRPGHETNAIVGKVVTVGWAVKVAGDPDLLALSREVYGRYVLTVDTLVQLSVTTELGREHGEGEALGEPQGDVNLTVLAVLLDANTGANAGVELVKDKGEDLTVRSDGSRHGALRATGTGVLDRLDVNLLGVRTLSGNRGGKSEKR
jgi:hypothetical protein